MRFAHVYRRWACNDQRTVDHCCRVHRWHDRCRWCRTAAGSSKLSLRLRVLNSMGMLWLRHIRLCRFNHSCSCAVSFHPPDCDQAIPAKFGGFLEPIAACLHPLLLCGFNRAVSDRWLPTECQVRLGAQEIVNRAHSHYRSNLSPRPPLVSAHQQVQQCD